MTTPNEELRARHVEALRELREEIDGTNYDDHSPREEAQLAALDYAIAALARQEEGREAEWPLFTWSGIAPRKLDALRSQGWSVNGYALYRDGMRGLIDLHGAVHWVGDSQAKHRYWGAGEPDCPKEIKAANGELHTLRCKVCGQDNPKGACPAPASPQGVSETAVQTFAAWFRHNYPGPDTIISDPDWHAPRIFRQVAYAIRTAAGAAPEGWQAVPREPTKAMVNAARRFSVPGYCIAAEQWPAVYRAMLAATPTPQSAGVSEETALDAYCNAWCKSVESHHGGIASFDDEADREHARAGVRAVLALFCEDCKWNPGLCGTHDGVTEQAALTAAGAAPGGWQAALVNEWESAAKDLRKDGLYRCCAGTYEHCAAHLKAGAQHGQEG